MAQGSASDPTAHPRPLLRRALESLDGEWDFCADADAKYSAPGSVSFDEAIRVPFAPETPASGIGRLTGFDRTWYRRRLAVGAVEPSQRLLLHFGAVDREATVWANDVQVAQHVGGYASFTADVTDQAARGELDIVVRADDDARAIDVPRGKQDWEDEPHRIWYPRTSGIWRSVWLERVPITSIASLHWSSDPGAMTVSLAIDVEGPIDPAFRVSVQLSAHGRQLAEQTLRVTSSTVSATFAIGDGGMDDRRSLVWSPANPVLVDAVVQLTNSGGDVVDSIESYTAIRSVRVDDGHYLLNNKPINLLFALDQGYWPESGATPPDTDALRRDLELTRTLGFNGVRKHQKIEDPRFFAWADRMGMLVWVEMPSAYVGGARTAANLLPEWSAVVQAHANYPSVIGWVPINESWGVPNLEGDVSHRSLVTALAATTTALDPSRPVCANDGWEVLGGDILGIHDYTQHPDDLRRRFGTRAALADYVRTRRADGKLVVLDGADADGRAAVLSEFGGTTVDAQATGGNWGYDTVSSPEALVDRVRELWAEVHASDVLVGGCWTQLTDTYQEVNGLLTFDRRPKADPQQLAAAVRGLR